MGKCKWCKFFDAAKLQCMLNPPVGDFGFPKVSENDWCGKYSENVAEIPGRTWDAMADIILAPNDVQLKREVEIAERFIRFQQLMRDYPLERFWYANLLDYSTAEFCWRCNSCGNTLEHHGAGLEYEERSEHTKSCFATAVLTDYIEYNIPQEYKKLQKGD